MQLLTTHMQNLRFDWAATNTAMVLITLLAVTLPLLAQLRRLRRQSNRDLQRIFELLDLMHLSTQEQCAERPARNGVPTTPQPQTPTQHSYGEAIGSASVDVVDYRTAARMAERGTSISEIAARCGLASGEARVLVALQQARTRQAVNS